VTERIDGQGNETVPLRAEELSQVAARLLEQGVEAVAISFLNAYRNPSHEQAAAAYFQQLLPEVFVTPATDLSRQWHEFERTATAVANAYVGPKVKHYVQELERGLGTHGFRGQFLLTSSSGGALSSYRAATVPLYIVESGPVGGCIAAATLGPLLGFENMIAFDMGGTTAKCTLIEGGRFSIAERYDIGGYERGFPIQVPVLDVVEVGAGGGSIAWLDSVNGLHVGPRSAGSHPGPVCYRWGGVEPTVTDANVVLGRLDPARFLGGDLPLDAEAAHEAIAERIAHPLGFRGMDGVRHVADGILSITTVIMAGAIKRITVERGRDPRDYALCAYGGAGPLHAVSLARELQIPWVIVPPEPGNFSAIGMLLADVRRDDTVTFAAPADDNAVREMLRMFEALESDARRALAEEFGHVESVSEHYAEIRYKGQEHSVLTPVRGVRNVVQLQAVFAQTYQRRYGHFNPSSPMEIVNLHLVSLGRINKPDTRLLQPTVEPGEPLRGSRPVVMLDLTAPVDVRVYDRGRLPPGFTARGPAVIEEYGSTTLVGSGDAFAIGPFGEIRIRLHDA